ncbi:MAG: serine/threonine-protein kinase [Balneolales bacterium]|nr:serine/threonine-protein kinase [Balneolales bacterium]
MNSDTWTRAYALFDDLFEMSEEEQQNYLKKLEQSDPELHAKMLNIYGFSLAENAFMNEGVFKGYSDFIGDFAGEAVDPEPMEGRLIGSYRILKQIGYGGMGAVYLAERADGAFDRMVALKFIRSELQHKTVIERFRREQRIQASLHHEAIPRLYDAGTDEHGTPYIVMDYVEGEPVTDYVKRTKPALQNVLQLFIRVCEVIHFAHQNLIIHRDLKPSNIFITADGDIKLLDFGIAKLVDIQPEIDSDEVFSSAEADMGARTLLNFFSLKYAAPEQIKGGLVTTGTDIYALGLILHELLCGALPYDIRDKSPAEIEDLICNSRVHMPPTEFIGSGENPRLLKELKGDLGTIMVKALEKEPGRRYESVSAMADDLRRYLENKPILAQAPGAVYTCKKFIQRNSAWVVSGSVILLVMLSGMIYHSVTVSAERDLARVEAEKFSQMAGFLIDLFDYDELAVPPEEATVVNLLDAAVEKLESDPLAYPEVHAEMMMALGRSFAAFGDNVRAHELITRGAEAMLEMGASFSISPGEAYAELARANFLIGNPSSLELIDVALEVIEQEHGIYSPQYAAALHKKAIYLYRAEEGNEENRIQAEALLDQYLHIAMQIFTPDDSRYTLAFVEHAMYITDFDERMNAYERALALTKEVHGTYHHRVANIYNSIAFDIRTTEPERSVMYFHKSLDIYNELYGANHHRTITTMTNLSSALRRLGRTDEAIDILAESVQGAKRLYRPGSVRIADQQFWLANAHMSNGNLELAGQLFLEVLDVYDIQYEAGSQKPELARTLAGQILMNTGEANRGRRMIEQSIRNTIELHGESHSMVAFSRARLNN